MLNINDLQLKNIKVKCLINIYLKKIKAMEKIPKSLSLMSIPMEN